LVLHHIFYVQAEHICHKINSNCICFYASLLYNDTSRNEYNSGAIQKLPFGINTTMELKKKTKNESDNTGIWRDMYQLTSVPVLPEEVVTYRGADKSLA
jgi:hypothetical protein